MEVDKTTETPLTERTLVRPGPLASLAGLGAAA